MTLEEMHKLFRVLGQQMGIQQIRGILPSEIDGYLNDAIITKVRNLFADAYGQNNELRTFVGAKDLLPINALRTLLKTDSAHIPADFALKMDAPNDMMLLLGVTFVFNGEESKSCRLIDYLSVDNTINDYCNRPTARYPIAYMRPMGSTLEVVVEIGVDKEKQSTTSSMIEVVYYKNPAIVHFPEADEEPVPCDLPDYLHTEIVEIAVNKFFQSVGYTSPTNSQKQTVQ